MAPRLLTKLARVLELGLLYAACAALVVLAAGTAWSVFTRFVLNVSSTWVVEIGEYMLIFITFFAAAHVQQQGRHVVSRLFVDALSPRKQDVIKAVASVLMFLSVALLCVYGFRITWEQYERGVVIYNVIFIERWIIYLPATIGVLALLLRLLIDVIEDILAALARGGAP